jgi:transposase
MLSAMNLRREVFQHDNARPYTARVTVDFLANQNVTILPSPSKSPDLNPIEHLWDNLDRLVRSRQPAPQTLQELQQALEQEWGRIPQDRIRRLITAERCRAEKLPYGGSLREACVVSKPHLCIERR